MGDIIRPLFLTTGDVNPKAVLDGAIEANLKDVIIIARTQDDTPYYAASSGDLPNNLTEVEIFKTTMLNELMDKE